VAESARGNRARYRAQPGEGGGGRGKDGSEVTDIRRDLNATEICELPISSLFVDVRYQRTSSQARIKEIATSLDLRALGVLIVSAHSNDRYAVIDGQTRLAALRKRDVTHVWCMVHRDLSVEDEAQIFLACNTVRGAISAIDKFRAQSLANDPIARDIASILEELGLTIGINAVAGQPAIRSVSALSVTYRRHGGGNLRQALRLIRRSFPNPTQAADVYQGTVIKGFAAFIRKYPAHWHPDELPKRLQDVGIQEFLKRSRLYAQAQGVSMPIAVAETIIAIHNHGRTGKSRLERGVA
jgi:hypothetical protein